MYVVTVGIFCSLLNYAYSQAIAQSFTLPPFGEVAQIPNAQQNIVVVDTQNPSGAYSVQRQTVDCSDTLVQFCNQEAWTDFGLAISGIIPKNNLCLKYAPASSCLSVALSNCSPVLNNVTKTMMLAFARIVVSWCYDGGLNLNALETHNECLSMAMFDAMTTQGCLFDVVAPFGISQIAQKNADGFQLTKLLNNLVGTYQSSTVICMKKSIEDACGKEAADLSLGPAMEELLPLQNSKVDSTTTLTIVSKKVETKTYADVANLYSSAFSYHQIRRYFFVVFLLGVTVCTLSRLS